MAEVGHAVKAVEAPRQPAEQWANHIYQGVMMVWYLPIGVYDGIKPASQIVDSTVDLSSDRDALQAVLRLGSGSIPIPESYGPILEFLSMAPTDILLAQWLVEQEDADAAKQSLTELAENGLIMSFGEHPITDPRVAERQVAKKSPITRVHDDTAEEGDELVLIEAAGGEVLVHGALLDLVGRSGPQPISVGNLYMRLEGTLSGKANAQPDQILEAGLQSLVQAGAVEVMAKT